MLHAEIHTEQWVLISSGDDLELLGPLIPPKPAPAGTLNRGGLCIHLSLEVVDGAKVRVDLFCESAAGGRFGGGGTSRGEILPEQLGK